MTSGLQTFETEMLAEEENFAGLARVNRELIGRTEAVDSPQRVVLDMEEAFRAAAAFDPKEFSKAAS